MLASAVPEITPRNKIALAVLVGFLTVFLYWFAGWVAEARGARELPLSAIDRAIPLMPWTVWIYLSIYFVYAASCILQNDLEIYRKFLKSYLIAYFGSTVFFLLFPTTFPRDAFVVRAGPDASVSEAVLSLFRLWDKPTNCFPSMHVASAVLATLPFRGQRPILFRVFAVWAVAIGVTTVTTKQHYAADVIAGAGFGWLCHFVAFRSKRVDPRSDTSLISAP